MVVRIMSNASQNLPDDPAFLKAMIAALQADNAKMSATLQAHDQLIGELRLRIAKLKKQVFGKSSEKIEREIQQLELALEDLLIAAAENSTKPLDEVDAAVPAAPVASTPEKTMRRRPRVSEKAAKLNTANTAFVATRHDGELNQAFLENGTSLPLWPSSVRFSFRSNCGETFHCRPLSPCTVTVLRFRRMTIPACVWP